MTQSMSISVKGPHVFDASGFTFEPPPEVARARRVLLKPQAGQALPYPISTSRELLGAIIDGIRRVSDADVLLLESANTDESVRAIYRSLGYNFPRVMALDVRECVWVEVENPLAKPFALSSFWVPNVLLSCDYLISVAPFKVTGDRACFALENLLGLPPPHKYKSPTAVGRALQRLGLETSSLTYTSLCPCLGIVDADRRFFSDGDALSGRIEEYGKIFLGEPLEVDRFASETAGVETGYVRLIETAKSNLAV
jgi:hypothetical protein